MGSGRGDRNQPTDDHPARQLQHRLQWGPVVVTGISDLDGADVLIRIGGLQWGPVVVTGISQAPPAALQLARAASMGSGRGDRNQWRLVIQPCQRIIHASMGSGRGDRNQC